MFWMVGVHESEEKDMHWLGANMTRNEVRTQDTWLNRSIIETV
jgi:hypothetical protein